MAFKDIIVTPVKWGLTVVVLPLAALTGLGVAGYALFKGGEHVADKIDETTPEDAASAGARHIDGALKKLGKFEDYLKGAGSELSKATKERVPEIAPLIEDAESALGKKREPVLTIEEIQNGVGIPSVGTAGQKASGAAVTPQQSVTPTVDFTKSTVPSAKDSLREKCKDKEELVRYSGMSPDDVNGICRTLEPR